VKTASISPERGGGDEVEEMKDREAQKKGEVTPPRDEVDPLKKRKVSPQKPFFPEEIKSHHDQDADCPHLR
jgi:hypothetical protein